MTKICENCRAEFDQKEHIPISLNCSHLICLECDKNLKNNNTEGYCPICKKLNNMPFKSTKQFNIANNNKLIKSKSNILRVFKKINLNKNRRLSHAIQFNNKNKETGNIVCNTLPKMKSFSKITVDDSTFQFDEFIKKRKINNTISIIILFLLIPIKKKK